MADADRTYMLFYDYVDDMLERRTPAPRGAPGARCSRSETRGNIVMAGALGDPPTGAAIVFRASTPSRSRRSSVTIPYVKAGLVTDWRVEPWTLV